jgi:hypothetical protein
MVQLACGITTDADLNGLPDTTDVAFPAPQNVFLYLITGENLLGEGPLGPANATPPRIHDNPCP